MPNQFIISVEEYIASALLNGEMTQKGKRIHLAIDISLLILGVVTLFYGRYVIACASIGAVIGGNLFPFLLRKIYVPWMLKKHYEKYSNIKKPISASVENEGIKFESTDGANNVLKWLDIYSWRENNFLLLIYLAPNIYNIVPKRIETEGFPLQELRQRLLDNVGNAI